MHPSAWTVRSTRERKLFLESAQKGARRKQRRPMSLLSRTTIGWGAAAALLLATGAQAQEITPGASGVTASANDGNVPSNAVDNNLDTRWSANGDGQWLQLDLGSVKSVGF